jgi:hypothetical protein
MKVTALFWRRVTARACGQDLQDAASPGWEAASDAALENAASGR